MTLLSKIKKGVAESGGSKGKIIFIKSDSKVRLRFLQDVEDGIEVTIHDSFDRGINAICRGHFDEECPYCNDESLRTRSAYAYSVWDEEAKEVKVFLGYANSFNPLPQLIGMYEAYGNITDRDYVLSRNGKGTNTTYGVVPMDKVKFKNKKAKPFSEDKLLELLGKAYPVNDDDQVANKNGKKKTKRKQEEPEEEDEEEDENDYESMSPKELYVECKERGLKAKPKQKAKYYIDMLLEDDAKGNDEDWEEDEEDEEDEW